MPEKFEVKVTTIEKAKDTNIRCADKLIGSLQNFKKNLKEVRKAKVKPNNNIVFNVKSISTQMIAPWSVLKGRNNNSLFLQETLKKLFRRIMIKTKEL